MARLSSMVHVSWRQSSCQALDKVLNVAEIDTRGFEPILTFLAYALLLGCRVF